MPRSFGCVLSLAVSLAVVPAVAQEAGNAEAGHELSSQLCTSCHIVGNESSGSDLAPPFPVIAKDPNTSLIQLHSWDEAGHPTLRHLALTPRQVADIDAYLDSLRGAAGVPVRRPGSAPERTLPQAPPDQIGPPIGGATSQ